MRTHQYKTLVRWTGNTGNGTKDYRSYTREHIISAEGKQAIEASSDPSFRGDAKRYNPEELFLSSLSSCHMLWYLHLCSEAGVVIIDYEDTASGTMLENRDGSGCFTNVTLRPVVTVAEITMIDEAYNLHHKANQMCFIASSVNFPVTHEPVCRVAEKGL